MSAARSLLSVHEPVYEIPEGHEAEDLAERNLWLSFMRGGLRSGGQRQ